MAHVFQTQLDFSRLAEIPAELYWLNGPPKCELTSQGSGAGLRIFPDSGTDFWQKTFYTPTLIKSSGPALLRKIPYGLKEWKAEVKFSLENANNQFD